MAYGMVTFGFSKNSVGLISAFRMLTPTRTGVGGRDAGSRDVAGAGAGKLLSGTR